MIKKKYVRELEKKIIFQEKCIDMLIKQVIKLRKDLDDTNEAKK